MEDCPPILGRPLDNVVDGVVTEAFLNGAPALVVEVLAGVDDNCFVGDLAGDYRGN